MVRGTGSGPSGLPDLRAKPLIQNGFPGRTPDAVRRNSENTKKHAVAPVHGARHARQTVTHVPQAATLRQPQASRQARSGRCRSSAARARPLIPHGFQSQIMDADGCCRPDRPSGAVLHTPRIADAACALSPLVRSIRRHSRPDSDREVLGRAQCARNAGIRTPPVTAGPGPSGTDTRPTYVPDPRSGRRTLQRTGGSLENSASCLSVTQMYSLETAPIATRLSRELRRVSLRDHGVFSGHTSQ